MSKAANGSAAAPGANHHRGARMAVTPCPLPLSDFPPDLIQAVARVDPPAHPPAPAWAAACSGQE